MLTHLFSLEMRRRQRLKRLTPCPLADYLSRPFPKLTTDCRQLDYLALDLETTGLNPRNDQILSFGYVTLHGMRIDLATAVHQIVLYQQQVPEKSVVIHRLTDDMLAKGTPLETIVASFLQQLTGKVLLAHHAEIEFRFLDAFCRKTYHQGFLAPVIDTQWLARRTLERRHQPFSPRDLRLSRLRQHYHLPRYRAHHALSDAIAAAELFMAQIADDESKKMPLRDYLRRL